MKEKIDFKKIGLKVGLEIHQQLDTHKLFCECPSILREDVPHFVIKRKLRAVAGELGEIDIAAKAEEIREKIFCYEGYYDTTCLVEIDEEPPHYINREALEIALQVALLLNMNPVDEVQIMRKTVIDGSNTTGFQRTALIALGGNIKTSFGNVALSSLCLEEDSAREIKRIGNEVYFRLDRLGIPLIEIQTLPQMKSPEEVKETAEAIGLALRMTGKVKRGLGTIRQDINVSIKGGNRVEIKGVQNLKDIPKIVEYEAIRQLNLIQISKEMKKKKVSVERKFIDISQAFENTKSKMILDAIERGDVIIGAKVKNFSGFLNKEIQPNKRLAIDILDYVNSFTGIKGFIHSDELPKYGITDEEIKKIREILECDENDLFIFVFGKSWIVIKSLEKILERINQIRGGVPKEVRGVQNDGTTRFLRPMPGKARMYPETDTIPIAITKEILSKIKIPELPQSKLKRLRVILGEELAGQIIRSRYLKLFEELNEEFPKIKPTIVANLLLSLNDIAKKYNFDASKIGKKEISEVLQLLDSNKIVKESIPEIIAGIAGGKSALEVAEKKKLLLLPEEEVERIIEEIISKNPNVKDINKLMNFSMAKLRGKAPAKLIRKIIESKLK